jgi:hypothetical protein
MNSKQGYLSSESINSFIVSLHGMAENEVNKAKELYLRNAIADYETARSKFNSGLFLQIPLCIIPIFLPIIIYNIRSALLDLKNMKTQIYNTIEVWGNDLGSKKETLEDLMHKASTFN